MAHKLWDETLPHILTLFDPFIQDLQYNFTLTSNFLYENRLTDYFIGETSESDDLTDKQTCLNLLLLSWIIEFE